MKPKILITGLPQSGKSTLVSKLIEFFSNQRIPVKGFLTPEVRKGKTRIGFNILNITTKERFQLARAGNYKTKYKLGKYSVFVKEFEKVIRNLEKPNTQKGKIFIIDEIGKMELFSTKFQEFIKTLFSSDICILATISLKLHHPLKNYLLRLPNIHLITLHRQNFNLVFQKVTSLLSYSK